MRKQRWVRILFVGILLGQTALLSGCGFKSDVPDFKVDLQFWGVFDDSSAYNKIFEAWRTANPFVGKYEYKKFAVDTYKQDLIEALAAGNGPDVFMIRNSWIPAFADKIVPMPAGLIDPRQYQSQLVDVAVKDNVGPNGEVYGVPTSVDSLALFYNKDLFNAAGISTPPETWEQLQTDVARLTNIDANGNIITSGISLGGWDRTPTRSGNINRATDVLMALVAQKGGLSASNQSVDLGGSSVESALDFYSQFSAPQSPYYCWNPTMHQSLDAFSEGRLAMTVNYSWQYQLLKRKNAKLNIGVAPLPQFAGSDKPANFANYWTWVVSKNTANRVIEEAKKKNSASEPVLANPAKFNEARILEAWEFLKFLNFPNDGTFTLKSGSTGATKEVAVTMDPTVEYLQTTGKPAARRDLIEKQKIDPILGPFAEGNLIATSWFQRDPETIETLMNEALAGMFLGEASRANLLNSLSGRIGGVIGEE